MLRQHLAAGQQVIVWCRGQHELGVVRGFAFGQVLIKLPAVPSASVLRQGLRWVGYLFPVRRVLAIVLRP